MKGSRQRGREDRGGKRDAAIERGRHYFALRAWADAYGELSCADRLEPLPAEDLERLATATYLIGRDDEYLQALERAHHAYLHASHPTRAVHCAFWLGFRLLMRGEAGRANGWFGRGQRLLDEQPHECAERGYLLLPLVEQRMDAGDYEGAYAAAADAVALAARCADADLVACALHQQGRIRILQGRIDAGLALLDETMLAVTWGELSPLVTGLMYCSVISTCQQIYALDRTREWTAALAHWCEGQRDMVAFAGVCRVHRAEILQLQGAWADAIEEARRASTQSSRIDRRATAAAFYQQAEIRRLEGDFAAAEEAYRAAAELGLEPQPGLALLRLAQGRIEAAATAIRRIASTVPEPLKRMGLLPAYVEIMLAAGEREEARNACGELEGIARNLDGSVPAAMAAQARGAIELAEGEPHAALRSLHRTLEVWQQVEAPHAAARVRVLIGLACRRCGDEDGANLQFEAARAVFERLGARPDVAHVEELLQAASPRHPHGLTPRELQVLRLVATGETNKGIARKLALSEKTVDRHVSNILGKLNVASRTAAAAVAYQRRMV